MHRRRRNATASMYQLQERDPNVFVGTVEGAPDIEAIKEILIDLSIERAYLVLL